MYNILYIYIIQIETGGKKGRERKLDERFAWPMQTIGYSCALKSFQRERERVPRGQGLLGPSVVSINTPQINGSNHKEIQAQLHRSSS